MKKKRGRKKRPLFMPSTKVFFSNAHLACIVEGYDREEYVYRLTAALHSPQWPTASWPAARGYGRDSRTRMRTGKQAGRALCRGKRTKVGGRGGAPLLLFMVSWGARRADWMNGEKPASRGSRLWFDSAESYDQHSVATGFVERTLQHAAMMEHRVRGP